MQKPTALQHILANYVVSKLLEMEKGEMAIFYLRSETEAVFDPSPLLKNLSTIFRKYTYIWSGKKTPKIQQEHRANQQ